MTRASLTRLYRFSSAHRLMSPHLDEAQNQAVYRDCFRAPGHGHNYRLEVTVRGPLDARRGMVVDLDRLDRLVGEHLLDRVDHRFLGTGDGFEPGFITTSEALAQRFWEWLAPVMPAGVALVQLHLWETDFNHVTFRGEDRPQEGPP